MWLCVNSSCVAQLIESIDIESGGEGESTYSSASSSSSAAALLFFGGRHLIHYRDVVWLIQYLWNSNSQGGGKRCIIVSWEYKIVLLSTPVTMGIENNKTLYIQIRIFRWMRIWCHCQYAILHKETVVDGNHGHMEVRGWLSYKIHINIGDNA